MALLSRFPRFCDQRDHGWIERQYRLFAHFHRLGPKTPQAATIGAAVPSIPDIHRYHQPTTS
jgi:hypothetical protein